MQMAQRPIIDLEYGNTVVCLRHNEAAMAVAMMAAKIPRGWL